MFFSALFKEFRRGEKYGHAIVPYGGNKIIYQAIEYVVIFNFFLLKKNNNFI